MDRKGCPMIGYALYVHRTAMIMNNVLGNHQSESRPGVFGRNKGLSQGLDLFLRHANPFVLHDDLNLLSVVQNVQGNGTALIHRFHGIFSRLMNTCLSWFTSPWTKTGAIG